MIGTTNAKISDKCADPHTLLLLTDDIDDKSMYNHGLYTIGQPKTCELMQRDGRNSIRFFDGNCLYSLKTDWIPSTTDWTLECWSYVVNNTNGCYYWQANGDYCGLLWGYNTNCNILFMGNTTTQSWNIVNNAGAHNSQSNIWSHKALVHSGNKLLAFTNGTLTWSTTTTASWNWSGTPYIGLFYNTNDNTRYLNGYLQDFRISDVARYTTNFTPPQRLL